MTLFSTIKSLILGSNVIEKKQTKRPPIDSIQLAKDWEKGLKWTELRAKYHRRTEEISELVRALNLPARHYGPVPAKDLNTYLVLQSTRMEDIINDYSKGVKIPDIMKKYRVGYETFREYVKPYKKLRSQAMSLAIKERHAKAKRAASLIRSKCCKINRMHLRKRS